MKHSYSFLAVLGLTAVVLTGCGGAAGVRESLGLNKHAPDEFRVVSRPPLSVPPDFTLRPPLHPGEGGGSFPPAADQAKAAILGTSGGGSTLEQKQQGATANTAVQPVISGSVTTPAEEQFLKNAGAEKADQGIRDTLYHENVAPMPQEEGFFSRWLGNSSEPPAPKSDSVVNAKKEAERIRAAKDTGAPINQGVTPAEEEKPGFFKRLFN